MRIGAARHPEVVFGVAQSAAGELAYGAYGAIRSGADDAGFYMEKPESVRGESWLVRPSDRLGLKLCWLFLTMLIHR